MKFRKKLRRFLRDKRNPPTVVICRSGQATLSPKVHVVVSSARGMQSVFTWNADDQGEACATLHGRSLAEIAGLRLIDERDGRSGASTA